MFDRTKLQAGEVFPSRRCVDNRDAIVAGIRQVAKELNYRKPRQRGDLTVLARALQRRRIMPPGWKRGERGWIYRGRGPQKLERFLRMYVPELSFPMQKCSEVKPG